MKIRAGFVSNSSSSSFVLVNYSSHSETFPRNRNTYDMIDFIYGADGLDLSYEEFEQIEPGTSVIFGKMYSDSNPPEGMLMCQVLFVHDTLILTSLCGSFKEEYSEFLEYKEESEDE